MNDTDSKQDEAPNRIWLLKSVVALLGTSDFVVPEKMREHAFEYVRAVDGDAVDRKKAAWAAHAVVIKHECVNSVRAGQLATEVLKAIEALDAADSSPAPAEGKWDYQPDEETLLDQTGNKQAGETLCACRTFALDPVTRAYLDGCDFVHTVVACPEIKLSTEPLQPTGEQETTK